MTSYDALKTLAEAHGQEHLFQFWDELGETGRKTLLAHAATIDFALLEILVKRWIHQPPPPEHFSHVEPIPLIPSVWNRNDDDALQALEAGEETLRLGKAGIFLVAGGQGTRLGFPGPKGAYPIGPLTGKSFFEYHAEKIHALQRRYNTQFPWYIMVSRDNAAATRTFFAEKNEFGLHPEQIHFVEQDMMPCVDAQGRILLAAKDTPAMNPNGHGGCITAMENGGVLHHAREHGIEYLCYFQVDNWAARVIDPHFLGYHVLRNARMSSKVHLKSTPREPVGVHCLCDGEYRIIEYSELDLYPQLLQTTPEGKPRYNAGNSAIHILSVEFAAILAERFNQFPWHPAHKKIPFLSERGELIQPVEPNGYKFETFIFDALRFTGHPPLALVIPRAGEYTPTKQFDGENSVTAARQTMTNHWAAWLEEAGVNVPRDSRGNCPHHIEISPRIALDSVEFRSSARHLPEAITANTVIDHNGHLTTFPS